MMDEKIHEAAKPETEVSDKAEDRYLCSIRTMHPHVSNDNPYSKAQFKTMKYRPDFPVAYEKSPEPPTAKRPPMEAWINNPTP